MYSSSLSKKARIASLLVLASVQVFLISCGSPRNSTSNDATQFGARPAAARTEAELRFIKAQTVFSSHCIKCHTSFGTLTEAQFFSQNLAKAGSLADSKVYVYLRGASASGSMPPSSTLSVSDREAISQWILGASSVTAKAPDALSPETINADPLNSEPEAIRSSDRQSPVEFPTSQNSQDQTPPGLTPQPSESPSPGPIPTPIVGPNAIERFGAAKALLTSKCMDCHHSWGTFSEQDFLNTSTETEEESWKLVTAGQAAKSALYIKLKGVSPRPFGNMPIGPRPALSPEERLTLQSWIENIGTP